MSEAPKPRRPAGLRAPGRRLWDAILARYELRTDELEILEQAARTLDVIDELRLAVAREGATVPGSKGQPRVHPAAMEARQQRLVLASLLRGLGIPETSGVRDEDSTSSRARRAARSRWDSRTAVRGA